MAKLIDIGFPSSGSSISNGGTIVDDSGGGNTLTVGGGAMSLVAGQGGQAGVADGTTYARRGSTSALRPATAVTWMCWLRRTSASMNWGGLMGYSNNAGWGYAYGFYTQSDDVQKIHINITTDAGETESPNNTNILALNTWVHVAGVWTTADTTLRLFVNGSSSQTWSRSGANLLYDNASHGFNIFRSDQFTGEIASGAEMDEARVFDTALSGSEITTEMNTRSGGGGGVVSPYGFWLPPRRRRG